MAARLILAAALAPCALASTLALASGETPRTLHTHFTYRAEAPSLPPGAHKLRLWVPIPSDNAYQKITNLKVTGPSDYRITTEPKYGNRMVYVETDRPIKVAIDFDCDRKEVDLQTGGGARSGPAELRADLQPDTLVPVGGPWADLSKEIAGTKTTRLDKMRAFFDQTIATMQYDYKKESPHLGEGDVAFVCDYKKGNCSDLHSYIISLARSAGIPCYLEYGFPLTGIPVPSPAPATGKIGGYHCWIWFYDEDRGWLPLDASDGRRWLDADKPVVKDSLVGSLVLERSAVAFSKGRDITLNPAQAAPPLNNFIYPYAEADGKSVPATWEINYELAAQGDLAQQLADLRKVVAAQQAEIDALKAGRSGNAAPVVAKSKSPVDVYGFVRLDGMRDSSQADNTQKPTYLVSPDATGGSNREQFAMHPRLTRIGVNLAAPQPVSGWNATGQIEMDFQNGGSESRPTPRARQLWMKLARGPSSLLFGQTWDVISPLNPSPNDDTLMWNAGNLGDRRPQVRYTYDTKTASVAVALGLTGAIDGKDLDGNGIRDGEQSGEPHLQARVGWQSALAAVGLWGEIGAERTATAVGGRTHFESQLVGVDAKVKLTHRLDVIGEAWTGQNLSDFRGGVGQGINPTTGREITSAGGWAEFGFQVDPKYRVAVGYSLDDPRNGDVAANGRTRNYAWYLANKWKMGPVEFGLNYLYWTTDYKGLRRGIDNRFSFFVVHRF